MKFESQLHKRIDSFLWKKYDWHDWYAWYPVQVYGDEKYEFRWKEVVYRCKYRRKFWFAGYEYLRKC